MNEILLAIILGVIQGLTEFLPVSSSGHLELAKFFLGDQSLPQESLLMTVVLHFATALSTVVVLRKEVLEIFKGLFQFKWNDEAIFSLKIIVSMIPAALAGIFLESEIDALFDQQIVLVSVCLVITGLLLFLANRSRHTGKEITYQNALIVGIAQAIAILPGISRSGATISTSVLLGIDRERAARFSFLMVVPLIFGKIAKDLLDGELMQTSHSTPALLGGFVAAFITGLLACHWMIQIVKKSKLIYFSIYCFIIAIVAIIFYLA